MDWIPGISQLKSGVQLLCGDVEGAKQTQKNFVDLCPGVSLVSTTQVEHVLHSNGRPAAPVPLSVVSRTAYFAEICDWFTVHRPHVCTRRTTTPPRGFLPVFMMQGKTGAVECPLRDRCARRVSSLQLLFIATE